MNRLLPFVLSLLILYSCGNHSGNNLKTCKVKKGIFNIDLMETGEISAVEAINISSPPMSWRYGAQKIVRIIEDGKEVKKGDTVLVLDPTEVHNGIKNAKSDLEIAQTELQKLKDEQQLKIGELEADLKIASLSLEISKIEFEQASYESEVKKKEIQLNLDRAKLDLDKAGQVIINTKKINQEDVNQANLRIRQFQNNIMDAENTLKLLTVLSPADGIPVLRKNWNTNNNWQIGDQVWSGIPLIDLPDLKKLKVTAEVNEVDVSKIALNQNAIIKIDAYPDSVFTGKVKNIASLARIKNEKNKRIKVFPVEIYVDQQSKILMPGMTVSLKITVNKLRDVHFVPLEALFKKDGKDFVYTKKGASFEKKEVTIGQANNDFVVIAAGLKENTELALTDPFVKKEETDKKKKK